MYNTIAIYYLSEPQNVSQTHIKDLIFFIVYMGIINQIEATLRQFGHKVINVICQLKEGYDNIADTLFVSPCRSTTSTLNIPRPLMQLSKSNLHRLGSNYYPMESKHWRLVEGVVKYIAPFNPVGCCKSNCWHELSIVVLLCRLSVINPFWNDICSLFSRDSKIKPVILNYYIFF